MDNRGCFHSKKISNLQFAKKIRIDRVVYGEKDTGSGKLLKTIALHREKYPKSYKFCREFRHRNRQLTLMHAVSVESAIQDILF